MRIPFFFSCGLKQWRRGDARRRSSKGGAGGFVGVMGGHRELTFITAVINFQSFPETAHSENVDVAILIQIVRKASRNIQPNLELRNQEFTCF